MAKDRKTVWKMYSAWNYEKEIEDLNRASEQGWNLVKGRSFCILRLLINRTKHIADA